MLTHALFLVVLVLTGICLILRNTIKQLQQSVSILARANDEEQQKRERAEALRGEERKGRIAAEKLLREHAISRADDSVPGTTDQQEGQSSKPKQKQQERHNRLKTSEEFEIRSRAVSHLQSCFDTRNGTPRNFGVAPSSQAILKLRNDIGEEAIDGLMGFSHVWLLWCFHANTDLGTVKGVKAKVRPPRLNGESLGVFATRTPHRPNPIGLTLAKVESICGRTLTVSGIDLIDGTPILDIKPYVPAYDCPVSIPTSTSRSEYDNQSALVPEWIQDPPLAAPSWKVAFESGVEQSIQEYVQRENVQLYAGNAAGMLQCVREVIEKMDIRSKHRRTAMDQGATDPTHTLSINRCEFSLLFEPTEVRVTGVRLPAT